VQKLGMGKGLRCALTSMTNMGSGEMEAAAVASEQGKALRSKHKIPRRRASSMLSILQSELENEAIQRRGDPSLFEDFRPGDALECMMLQCMSSTSPDPVRGIVIAKKRRGVSSSFILRDVVYGTVVEKNIPLYSPLLQSIKVRQHLRSCLPCLSASKTFYCMLCSVYRYSIGLPSIKARRRESESGDPSFTI
jgi:ribosomal protein L19